MPLVTIDDPSDARLDDYRNIPDGDLVARRGIFIAEGRLVVERLLTESALAARSVMVTETARASLSDVFAARPEVPVYVVPQSVVDGVAGIHIHRGCLAIGVRPAPVRWQELIFRLKADATSAEATSAEGTLLVVLERVGNPDNVGGVFRNAAAFGADAVLLDAATTDPLYRKAIRTSMGASMRVPFARAEPWPDALHELRQQGFALLAMTPAADAVPLRECVARVSLRPGSGQAGRPVAVVLGHEGGGLTDAALEACDVHARIPMASGIDSVNVASATAIALYEVRRGP